MSTTPPTTPFWFKQRQGKLEAVGDHVIKVTAPNQNEAFLLIREVPGKGWTPAVRLTAEGEEVASSAEVFSHPWTAWEIAFELYRQKVIV